MPLWCSRGEGILMGLRSHWQGAAAGGHPSLRGLPMWYTGFCWGALPGDMVLKWRGRGSELGGPLRAW